MRELTIAPYRVKVVDNQVAVFGEDDQWSGQDVTCYAEPDRYATFEEFLAFCGDGLATRFVQDGDFRLLWFYDHRTEAPWDDCPAGAEEPCDPIGGNFGYVLNLDEPSYSEWGYCPVPLYGESEDEMVERYRAGLAAFLGATGPVDFVVIRS